MTVMLHPRPRISRTETQSPTNRGHQDKLLRLRETVRNVLISHFYFLISSCHLLGIVMKDSLISWILFSVLSSADILSHVNGHRAKHKSDSNSEQEEAAEESSGEAEEEEQEAVSQKPSRSTATTPARKKRITSEEEEEEVEDTERRTTRHKPPVSSDEEDKDHRSQKHPHQNGRNVEEAIHKDSKKKSKVSPSKSQDKQKSASTNKLDGAESEELSDSPDRKSVV